MNENQHKKGRKLVRKLQQNLLKACESNYNTHLRVGKLRKFIDVATNDDVDEMDKELAEIEIQLFRNKYNVNAQTVGESLIALDMLNENFKWN